MTLAYGSVSQSYWPLWIAKEKGFLTKYGIDAPDLFYAEGNRTNSGLLSGATPIVGTSAANILDPIAQGADIITLLTTSNKPTDMLVGGKGIVKGEDLKGKAIGVNELGGEADFLGRLALKSLGLEPDVDTRVVSVGGESTRIAALVSNQVQGTLVDVGLRKEMADQGFTTLYDFTTGNINLAKAVFATLRSYADANPEAVQCVVNALVDSIRFYKSNKAESVDAAGKYFGNLSKEQLESFWDIYAPTIPDPPLVDREAMANHLELLTDPKIKAIDLSKVIDNSFVENAQLKP